jgi:Skp family chaperone for outer membrane proteins
MNNSFALQCLKAQFYKIALLSFILLAGCSSQSGRTGENLAVFVDTSQICKSGLTKILLINNSNNVTEIISDMDGMQNQIIQTIDEPKFNEYIAKLPNKPCKNGFVNLPKIIVQITNINPQAKMSKEKLKAEFSQRDKDLVAMGENIKNGYVSVVDFEEAQEKFKADFNKRRNEELSALQHTVLAAVRIVAKMGHYDIVAMSTDDTNDAEKIKPMASLDDLTPEVIRQLSLPSQTEIKPLEKNPLRIVN